MTLQNIENILQKMSGLQRKDELVQLFTVIIENTTVMPFRFYCNRYMCFFCGCPFVGSNELKDHNREEHADTKIRTAFRCLLRNSRIKFEISTIKCKICSEQFEKLDEVLNHLQDIHGFNVNLSLRTEVYAFKLSEESMTCDECGEEFHFFGTLLRHFHAFHNKNEQYICEICGMAFVRKGNVSAHVKSVHSRDVPCDKCDTKNNKSCAHRKIPALSLKCPKCPEILSSPYLRKRHLGIVHDVKCFQFPCDLCPRVFYNRYRLMTHKQRVHLKQKSFGCEICGFRTYNRDYLARHMVSHNDSRPFECEFCKKSFQRKKTLQVHRRIHTNDRRCVCSLCGKAFVQTTSLKLHYRVHHSKENSRDEEWS